MAPQDFVHLHCHSTYSLLEALPTPEEIVQRTKELGQTAVALTDRGYIHGLIEFEHEAKAAGVKPILGVEAFLAARTRFNKESGTDTRSSPLVLLAENREGYQNLLELCTAAALEGMYYKPRVDWELLKKFGKGLIVLTGHIGGIIPQAALSEDRVRVLEETEKLVDCFGKGNVYYELLDFPNIPGQAEANQQLIRFGRELGIPVVAAGNTSYCRQEDAEAHDVLLCIQKNANIGDQRRFSMKDSDYSMRSSDEMFAAFAHVPEAIAATREIAGRCTVDFTTGGHHIPRFPVAKGMTEAAELRRLCEEGLNARYAAPKAAHRERLDYELSVIEQMGFSGYFLIVADFITEAKRRGITVGPGRGSAAGSIVSYCLGITALDPLEHGLIFERFLNPERVTLPDIDTDFADTRRDEVLEYVRSKYGADRVVQICTFGTLAARAAVKDVGRVYGIPFLEMNTLAKLIPERPGTTLAQALETAELKSTYESNDLYRKIIDTALKLEGKARHVSVHACGVIISPEPAIRYTALQRAPKDEATIITQYDAKPLESLGLLKMDFLGLTNLTVIQTALKIIERTRGTQVDITTIPLNDRKTYQLLQRGDTTGVFQFESPGMRRYLRQLKPTAFQDITAMAALYRPGPMEWIPSYIKRKHGEEKVEFLHPSLERIFQETYGIGVYQEQILELARVFSGYTLGEADLLRRAIGKKIKSELDAQREKFVKGAVAKGNTKQLAMTIFEEVIMPFAGYGFPKAHAAGYARIAYETAYLKARYPAEFMAALLSSDSQDTDRVLIEIEECRAMGLSVLPPDINESLSQFTVISEKEIRFGLAAIKGIGESSVAQIIAERESGGKFASIADFAQRMPVKVLNKKVIESLAKSGALDSLGERRTIVENYSVIVDYRKAAGDRSSGQGDLFGDESAGAAITAIEFPETSPASAQQKLQWEKETLGLYVSSHPLAGLRKYIGKKAQLIASLSAGNVGRKVTIAGIQEGIRKLTTKKGESMGVVTLEDPTGKIDVTFFPRTWGDAAALLEQPDTVLVIGGTLDLRAGVLQIRADAVKRASLSTMIERAKHEGFFDEEEAKLGAVGMRHRQPMADGGESTELLDEEGNVIAGTAIEVREADVKGDEFFGPLGKWIIDGMQMEEALTRTGLQDISGTSEGMQTSRKIQGMQRLPSDSSESSESSSISIHTVELPEQAPKKLLLDLRSVLETFPGREKVQLRIGTQLLQLPLTVSMSTILEKKIEEVLAAYR